jgi:hypothetical protein
MARDRQSKNTGAVPGGAITFPGVDPGTMNLPIELSMFGDGFAQ